MARLAAALEKKPNANTDDDTETEKPSGTVIRRMLLLEKSKFKPPLVTADITTSKSETHLQRALVPVISELGGLRIVSWTTLAADGHFGVPAPWKVDHIDLFNNFPSAPKHLRVGRKI
ncbi:hypothetical protein FGIG_00876 [Fasciola gigantica]|uniref:Uncharacterized protein n=1 Tax=Fasciola gigantica TaxID=46835 RepID=A0A504YV80_FASGI|nr:hypothetical protein FGIG_00876 [Fasciola gigantica]